MMVDASKPSLDVHDVYMKLWKVASFVRWYLREFWVILPQRSIPVPLICYHLCFFADPTFKEWAKRLGGGIVYDFRVSTAKAFADYLKRNDYKSLVLAAPAKDTLLCTADKELINVNLACKRVTPRTLHRLLYLPFKLPAGLLTKFVFFGKFLGRHSFLLGANLESNMESEQNRELALVKHGARCRTFVVLASGASAGIRKAAFVIVSVATLLADIFVTLPLDTGEVFVTGILGDEMLIKT